MTEHAVAHVDQLEDDRALRVKAGDEELIVLRHNGQVRAYQADCPHAGAPLEQGAICENRLICPWHKAAFALNDGEVTEPPALASLKRYRAQVRDNYLWVDDQPSTAPVPAPQAEGRTFIVAGAGAAGAAAVASLHRQGFAGQLVWVDQEAEPAYDRTALSKFVIAGKKTAAEVPPLLDDEVLAWPNLRRVRATVTAIDAAQQRITLDDGQHLTYDAALLATGGVPQRPAVEGAQLPGSFLLRSRDDAARILEQVRGSQRAVIVGDSFIGLEAASALRQAGLHVRVVSRHETPLTQQLGDQVSLALRQFHERNGVVFHTGTEPVSLEGPGRVETVTLKNGERLEADLVLFGTGVKPATQLARGLALADDQSLIVDAGMRAAPGLWAVGDMVNFPLAGHPLRIEHWRVAQQQGCLAAENMLGAQREYADVPFFWTLQHGKTLEVLGHARAWNGVEVVGDVDAMNFVALLCVDEQVESVVACGHRALLATLSQRMKRPLSRHEARALINS